MHPLLRVLILLLQLKLRHLSDVQLAKPGASAQTQTLSKFTAKKADYEVLSLGSDASSVGAGELQALTTLLGSKSSKKYTTGSQMMMNIARRQLLIVVSTSQHLSRSRDTSLSDAILPFLQKRSIPVCNRTTMPRRCSQHTYSPKILEASLPQPAILLHR